MFGETRQAVQARAPKVAGATAILAAVLVGAAALWAATARADRVVRVRGLVRPVADRGEMDLSAGVTGPVVEVNHHVGDEVRRGDVLFRLDSESLDEEIDRVRRTIGFGLEDLAELERLGTLEEEKFEAARRKAEAEAAEAERAAELEERRREIEIRLCALNWKEAMETGERIRDLARTGDVPAEDLREAIARACAAREDLERAQLPVDRGMVKIRRKVLEQVGRDFAVRKAEMEAEAETVRAELDRARMELADLRRRRRQAVVRAPFDGLLVAGNLRVGDVVEAGKPVMTVVPRGGFRFEIAVPAAEAATLSVGMSVQVRIDAEEATALEGRISFISPDARSEEKSGELFHNVEVKFGETDAARLRLGMAGTAEIAIGRESLLGHLQIEIRETMGLE